MLKIDEDSLICDLAETYGIYDYRQLPATQVAVFAMGLRDDSRIKLKLAGQGIPLDTLLLAGAVDRLSLLLWAKTEDGQKGRRRPPSLVERLSLSDIEKQGAGFASGEDFERARAQLLEEIGGEDGGN